MSTGKCPKCEKVMPTLAIQAMPIPVGEKKALRGVAYQCPHCQTVLSVGIDPLAIKADTLKAVKRMLGK